ncbi:MAG: NUDIX hydrolase [Chitinophagales bacterium]
MEFHQLTSFLKKELQKTLPADKVRLKMSPPFRKASINVFYKNKENARKAAVLILLYPHQDEIYFCLMKRTEDGYAHSGQISLPGGGVEAQDMDMIATALRETEEEFGIDRKLVQPIGQISELYIPVSNSLVFPVVAYISKRPVFIPNPKEVAQIIEVPVSYMFRADIVKKKWLQATSGFRMEVPYYDVFGHVVWGATAMMLSEFLAIVEA